MSSTISQPEVLTTKCFHAAVRELSPAVAVFDCDGTLWSGDAGTGFMRWTIDRGILSRTAIDQIDRRYRAYLRGEVSELDICGEMVQIYQGLRDSEMRSAAAEFFRARIETNLFPEMLDLISDLQTRGTKIWAVSSTCNWVVEEGASRFNIPAECVLAARVAIRDGVVTHQILDVPTDEAKVTSLARAGVTHPDAAFGNSIHDAAMLAIARRAFPVDPTPALLERSLREHWPIYLPASARSQQQSLT
jgi:phosphoserine phosphatase